VEGTRDGAAVREVDRILGKSVSSSHYGLWRLQPPRSADGPSFISAKSPYPIERRWGRFREGGAVFAHPFYADPENEFDAAGQPHPYRDYRLKMRERRSIAG